MRLRLGRKKETPLRLILTWTLVLLWVFPAGASVRKLEVHKKEIKLDKETKIFVRNSRGLTKIIGREGATAILVKASKKVKAPDDEGARKLLDHLTFEIEKSEDKISIITHYPKIKLEMKRFFKLFSRIKSRSVLDYFIEVPASMDVSILSASGDMEVYAVKGDVVTKSSSGDVILRKIGRNAEVELSSGDMRVSSIGGNLNVEGASGDLSADSIGGDAEVSLVSGDIEIRGCKGRAVAKTSSGDTRLAGVGGDITAGTSSGDISVTISPDEKRAYVLNTASGDIRVRYYTPPQCGFMLDVSTASGAISAEMTIQMEMVTRRVLKGRVGSGIASLKIVTASGDISIRELAGER